MMTNGKVEADQTNGAPLPPITTANVDNQNQAGSMVSQPQIITTQAPTMTVLSNQTQYINPLQQFQWQTFGPSLPPGLAWIPPQTLMSPQNQIFIRQPDGQMIIQNIPVQSQHQFSTSAVMQGQHIQQRSVMPIEFQPTMSSPQLGQSSLSFNRQNIRPASLICMPVSCASSVSSASNQPHKSQVRMKNRHNLAPQTVGSVPMKFDAVNQPKCVPQQSSSQQMLNNRTMVNTAGYTTILPQPFPPQGSNNAMTTSSGPRVNRLVPMSLTQQQQHTALPMYTCPQHKRPVQQTVPQQSLQGDKPKPALPTSEAVPIQGVEWTQQCIAVAPQQSGALVPTVTSSPCPSVTSVIPLDAKYMLMHQQKQRNEQGDDTLSGVVDVSPSNAQVDPLPITETIEGVSSKQEPEVVSFKRKQKALVKPQMLKHVIEGFVIHEVPAPEATSQTDTRQGSGQITEEGISEVKEKTRDNSESPKKRADLDESKSSAPIYKVTKCNYCNLEFTNDYAYKNFCSLNCFKKGRYTAVGKRTSKPKAANNAATMDTEVKEMRLENEAHVAECSTSLVNKTHDVTKNVYKGFNAPLESSVSLSGTSANSAVDMDVSSADNSVRSIPSSTTNPITWSVSEVCDFVRLLPGCSEYAEDFALHEIDGQALMLLKSNHLMSAMSMKLGPALKICAKIEELRSADT